MNEAYSPRDSMMDYASEFDYSVWTPGTTVTLCNVTWDAAYRDIVTFTNPAAILAHLAESAGPTVEIHNMTYAAYVILLISTDGPADSARCARIAAEFGNVTMSR